jgi:hypothetical protein
MKLRSTIGAIFAVAVITPQFTSAQVAYNANVTAIFGTGNPNTGWVTFTDAGDDLQLSLRAKDRVSGATPNDGAGMYIFTSGVVPSTTRAKWNYEFSINADPLNLGQTLNKLDYYLTLTPPGGSPMTVDAYSFGDDSFGNNSTPNGGGTANSGSLASSLNIAQNSENITFAPFSYNPFTQGIYAIDLYATTVGAGPGGTHIADANILVSVPEPSTAAFMGMATLGFITRFRKRR